ncbi:MAG: protein kinase domain-containing protein [Planctomycetota bacterium]
MDKQPGAASSERPPASDAPFPRIPDITISALVGRGGMGAVYLGKQSYIERDVAVKVLDANRGDPSYAARFQREARILANLTHPNVVACYSAGTTPDGNCYLVMEYVNGPNLRQYIASEGPLAPRHALAISRDVAVGLGHACMSNIIHRDVKPENVLLKPSESSTVTDGFPFQAKLADLGLARSIASAEESHDAATAMNITAPGMIFGTPATMSPEQFEDPSKVDLRTDIYGLGCVLYFMLTGSAAFRGASYAAIIASKQKPPPDPRQVRRELPPAIADLVLRMLATDRAERPSDYPSLIEELEKLRLAQPIPRPVRAGGTPRAEPVVSAPTRSRLILWLCVGALVLGGAGGAVWWAMRTTPAPIKNDEPVTPVANLRPTIQGIAKEPLMPTEHSPFTLRAQTADPEGDTLEYAWALQSSRADVTLDVASQSTANLIVHPAPGDRDYSLTFELKVRDGPEYEWVTQETTVEIQANDDAPSAAFRATKEIFAEGEVIELAVDATDDGDGSRLEYSWTVDGLPEVASQAATLKFTPPPLARAEETLRVAVAVEDRGRNKTMCNVELRVRAAADAVALGTEIVRPILREVGSADERLAGWRRAASDQGIWGLEEFEDAEGYCGVNCRTKKPEARELDLPRGPWTLKLKFHAVDDDPELRANGGLRIVLWHRRALAICQRESVDKKLAAFVTLQRHDIATGEWSDESSSSEVQTVEWSVGDPVEVELDYRAELAELRWRRAIPVGEQQVSWQIFSIATTPRTAGEPLAIRPTLALFVTTGHFCFCRAELVGQQP